MSDESATTDAPETSAEDKADEQTPKPSDTVDFWKAKAREQEKRAKENAEAAKRLSEIEESQKSETEKVASRLTEAEQRAVAAEAALLRYEVAAEKGVPAQAIPLLQGSTREDIEASAKVVLGLIGEAGKPRKPSPDPSQGRQSGGAGSTAEQFAAAIGEF